MRWSATRSGSACRSAAAGRTRRFSRRAKPTCGRRPAGSSGCRSTPVATRPTAWRSRRASSTSAARRRRRTSAPRRRCSPTSRRCTRSITVPMGCARSPRGSRDRRRVERALTALGYRQANARLLRHAVDRGRRRRPAVRAAAEARGINFRYAAGGIGHRVRRDRVRRRCAGRRRRVCRGDGQGRRRRSTIASGAPTAVPPALRRTIRVSDASGLQHAPLRDADDALHPLARAQGRGAGHVDDPARLVHDEAQRGVGDDAGVVAGVRAASTRSRRRRRSRATRRSSASSRRRSAGSPASTPCRCSRTRAPRESSPA